MKQSLIVLLIFTSSVKIFGQPAPKPYGALPSERQLKWQETDMYCIIHFSVATYTDKEWGNGGESEKLFDPSNFSAMQIVGAAKAGGFKGIVVVAKHHDGFCLWPTNTTEHNITKSPYKNGQGDIVKEYQVACGKLGMKMGIYCSPWDRNNALYGKPEYVTQVYRKQLEELYANYGPLFMSWHDGANGGDGFYGGAKEVRKIDRSNYYGWETTWGITRRMQPGACIFGDIGPDVRWVGNEEGHAGETYWATYTPHAPDPGKKPANGYSLYEEATSGTRNGEFWIPAECDVPLRAGWFYHQSQDGQTRSAYKLLDLYYKSVGRGACLDLGLSPDKTGRITDEDVAVLKEFGRIIKQTFSVNLAKGATLTASNVRGSNNPEFGPQNLLDDSRYTYWATDDADTTAQLVINLRQPKTFNVIRLRENIKLGQRIDGAAVDTWQNNKWTEIASVPSIGANRLIRLGNNVKAAKVRLRITGSPVCIALSDFGLFKEPAHLGTPVIKRSKNGNVIIAGSSIPGSIHYTLDGSIPSVLSPDYKTPIRLANGGIVKAKVFDNKGNSGDAATSAFGLSKLGWKVVEASSATDYKTAYMAIDEDVFTNWETVDDNASLPQSIIIDMGKQQPVKAFTYLPRHDKQPDGLVDSYIYAISNDGVNWQQVAEGEFSNIKANPVEQVTTLVKLYHARYFKFTARHVINGNGVAVAEIGVLTK